MLNRREVTYTMTNRNSINVDAVFAKDVARLLERLGLRDEFERGECHCHCCNDILNYATLKLLFTMQDRKVGFLCTKPECFVQFVLREEGEK